jgi:hypothetical protein
VIYVFVQLNKEFVTVKRTVILLATFLVTVSFLGLLLATPAAWSAPEQFVTAPQSSNAQGVFLTFHLEYSQTPRIQRLWPKLVDFMALADSYGAKVSLQFSPTWADYVFTNSLTDTVQSWETNGHEIALHHHGPTHKFFDGYTDRPDLIRTDGWYATDGVYVGDMAALMAFLDPLAVNPIVSAGMSDAETDWPAGVLYYASKAGADNAKTDLISTPWQTSYNGHTVTVVTNAGYAIDHLGSAAVTLADIEQGLQDATSDQVLGIVVNDDTIETHFDQIEPLFKLLQQYNAQARTVKDVVENYQQPVATPTATQTATATATPVPSTTPPPFTAVPDATYGMQNGVAYVRIPATDCTNVTATPIIVGDWLVFPIHEHTRNCSGPSAYQHTLLGYNMQDGKLYILRNDGAGEAPLLYQPEQGVVYWNTTFGGTVFPLTPDSFALRSQKVSVGTTSDSAGVYLDGLYYFGTVNTPDDNCQNPINDNCGGIFALDSQDTITRTLNTPDGFRAWVGTSLTTDGQYLYIGSAKQTNGTEGVENEYLYGCSVTKVDKDLNILASFDPGDFACYYLPYVGANADSVAGEVVPDGSGLWVQYVRPNQGSAVRMGAGRSARPQATPTPNFQVALYRLNLNLQEQCRVEFPFEPQTQAVGFYSAPTVDKDGVAYVTVSTPDGTGSRRGELYKVTKDCQSTLLAQAPGSFAHASPTLADDQYILFATDGKLQVLALDGTVVKTYTLATEARVLTSPVIHNGVIYVVQEDGSVNIIDDAGVSGYGSAIWPRYRHDNNGSASLSIATSPTPTPSPTPGSSPELPTHAIYIPTVYRP